MKTIATLIAAVLVCGLLGCDEEETSADSAGSRQLIVSSVKRCPNGHKTIKAVPMVYGLIPMTPETRRKEANYEAAYGGCGVDSHGKYKFVCTTCGSNTYEKFYGAQDGRPIWFDKTTRVIPAGKAILTAEFVD